MPEIILVPLADLHNDHDFNCREKKGMMGIRELAKSIIASKREIGFVHEDGHTQEEFHHGLMQVVVVRPHPAGTTKWQLVAGYRRTEAFTMLAREDGRYNTIPATVVYCTDLEAFKLNLAENIQREQLNIKEEANAVKRLKQIGLTQNQMASELGQSRGWVQVRLYLGDLPEDVQDAVVEYNVNQAIIRQLWALPTATDQRSAMLGLKEKIQRGVKPKTAVEKRERPLDRKLIPQKQEIYERMEVIANAIGWGFATRMMGWCVGDVLDGDANIELELAQAELALLKARNEFLMEAMYQNDLQIIGDDGSESLLQENRLFEGLYEEICETKDQEEREAAKLAAIEREIIENELEAVSEDEQLADGGDGTVDQTDPIPDGGRLLQGPGSGHSEGEDDSGLLPGRGEGDTQ